MLVKLLSEKARVPQKMKPGDSGFDLYSPEEVILKKHGGRQQVKIGIAIQVNPDEVALVQERSGMAIRYGIITVGNVIDSNYRGEISAILVNTGEDDVKIDAGSRIAQLLVLKLGSQESTVVDQLDESERGSQAHYSSGI